MAFRAGDELLHYRLVEKLGEGGMGVVWKAVDTVLDREVALKALPDELACDPERLTRFRREARALAALNHPHIAAVYSLHELDGATFLAMELVAGEALSTKIGPEGLPLDEVETLGRQVVEAVALAHARGIAHRDLKPDNVMVTPDGRAKVLDFGLARVVPGLTAAPIADAPETLTLEGALVGTIDYMSPEQAAGREADLRSDVFALGALLYEMATGRRPFRGESRAEVLSAILRDTPAAGHSLRAELSPALSAVLERCLRKNPAERFRDAAELLEALRASVAEPVGGKPGRATVVVGASAVALLVVAALWLSRAEDERAPPSADGGKRPSIAVLPFSDASRDPEERYFSDGLAEDIATELSKIQELTVTAYHSTRRYRDDSTDVRELGAELGVRYLLEGGVRRAGDAVRVTARLSDVYSGDQIWSEHFDGDLTAGDLFRVQDEITQRVVVAIAGSYGALARAGLQEARRKPPRSLDSYQCVLRTYEYLHVHTPANHAAARDCLERALIADPDYADGLAWLGYLYAEEFKHEWNVRTNAEPPLDRAIEAAESAVALDPGNQVPRGVLAVIHVLRGDVGRFRAEVDRAIELNPNNALWMGFLSAFVVGQGDTERAAELARRAIELTPSPPEWLYMSIFLDLYHRRRYPEALAESERVETGDYRIHLFRAAAHGQVGELDDAREEIVRMCEMSPPTRSEIRENLTTRHTLNDDLVAHLFAGLDAASTDWCGRAPS